jgi:hypothetical protein
MSIDPEDSALEQALRNDLPSPDTETRLRRRLLAAGVAIGNGVATTTAAAGTAASGTAATGIVAKVAGLSWGIKLGFAAVVAIPTLGLWLDGRAERRTVAPPAVLAPARAAEAQAPIVAVRPLPPAPAADTATEAVALEPEHGAPKAVKPGADVLAPAGAVTPGVAHPSQADFGAPESPTRAPQVASTLAEETRLLDSAFAALSAGDRVRASQLIQEHEARYPAGLLRKERERAKLRLSEMSRGE